MSSAPGVAPTAEDLTRLLDAEGVLIFESDGQELTVADLWPPHPAAASLRMSVGFGVSGLVARNGQPVVLDSDSPRNALHRELLRLEPRGSVARMCLPLFGLEDRIVGVLAAHRSTRRPFRDEEQRVAAAHAAILGLRIHAEQLWLTVNRHRTERDRLIKQAISAQEAERRRIAFDLHDGVTTALASMSFHLSAVDLTVSELAARDVVAGPRSRQALERARAELVSARGLADLAYHQTRAAISGLHSLVLDDLGLVAAMESLVQSVAGVEQGPSIDLLVDPAAELDDVPDHVAAALYRIAQEALANSVKHAKAEHIVLSLRRVGASIVLGCADDGSGFDVAQRRTARARDADGAQHFGLSSIAERCALIEASLRIESTPGRGTTLRVEFPL
ncbi:MAG TPA: GAF domain-containing protein [Marmoricola sp.]|nr:GAF domain-containing protein [Marmoricola sp.]